MGIFSYDDVLWELEKCKEEIINLNRTIAMKQLEIERLKEYIKELENKGDVKDGKEE